MIINLYDFKNSSCVTDTNMVHLIDSKHCISISFNCFIASIERHLRLQKLDNYNSDIQTVHDTTIARTENNLF